MPCSFRKNHKLAIRFGHTTPYESQSTHHNVYYKNINVRFLQTVYMKVSTDTFVGIWNWKIANWIDQNPCLRVWQTLLNPYIPRRSCRRGSMALFHWTPPLIIQSGIGMPGEEHLLKRDLIWVSEFKQNIKLIDALALIYGGAPKAQ